MRAKPLSIDDRRSLILDAAIPLIIAHGRDVTTRQVADRAGIAEGTVFRAFGDKENLIRAASSRHLDPAPLLARLGGIDPHLALDTKVAAVVALLRGHFELVFGMIAALGEFHHPRERPDRTAFTAVIGTLFEPHEHELNCTPQRVGQVVRFLAFSSALPPLNDGDPMTDEELTAMILVGVAGTSARLDSGEPDDEPEPAEGRYRRVG